MRLNNYWFNCVFKSLSLGAQDWSVFVAYPGHKKSILHECSCFIDFIKRVEEKGSPPGVRRAFSLFATSLILKLINTMNFVKLSLNFITDTQS